MKASRAIVALAAAMLAPTAVAAQEAAPASETSIFIFNTLLLIVSGALVASMSAGFCLLEVGLVRSRNAATICLKKIAAYAICGFMAWLSGFNLIYGVEPGGFLGRFAPWSPNDNDPVGAGVASSAMFFFQMALLAVAAMIVSGALAERVKFLSLLIFTAVLAGLIYPIAASWHWGDGYLASDWRFVDFAGATIVHSVGGWAALAGALVVGARRGKYHGRRVTPMPGSNLPLAALGAFMLWIGWFGFTGGAHRAISTVADAIAVATILVNTNIAAAGGVLSTIIMTSMIYKRIDLSIVFNGAIGGLVAIAAEPHAPAIWQAALIGAFAGVIVTVGVPLLDRLRIDDVVGAVPTHLFCGIWGTLMVPWSSAEASVLSQIVGVVMVGAFAFSMSALVWVTLKYSIGVRVPAEQEAAGLDKTGLGLDAYPGLGRA